VLQSHSTVGEPEPSALDNELEDCIARIEHGEFSVDVLQRIAIFCSGNPGGIDEDSIWTRNKRFRRLFKSLLKMLDPSQVSVENLLLPLNRAQM
jgi:hypothetical protein